MKLIITVLLLFFTTISFSQSDESQEKLNQILDTLIAETQSGNIKAIYDMTGFLDNKETIIRNTGNGTVTTSLQKICLEILFNYTDFHGIKISDTTSVKSIKTFLIDQKENIFFSPYLKKFTNQKLEDRIVEYRVRNFNDQLPLGSRTLNDYKKDIKKAIEKKDYYKIVKTLPKIGALQTKESKKFLLECSSGKHWDKKNNTRETQIWSSIAYGLRFYNDINIVKKILEISKNQQVYSEEDITIALARITNIHMWYENEGIEGATENMIKLVDSLNSMEALRQYGYDSWHPYSSSYFENKAEYFGAMLLEADFKWWIQYNASIDILKSKNPESLKFVGAMLFHGNEERIDPYGRTQLDVPELMKKYTKVEIEVKDRSGNWTSNYQDQTSKLNYLLYWFQNFHHYQWNEEYSYFENTVDSILPVDNVDVLFKLLSSEIDSIAFDAYTQLAQMDQKIILEKLPQFELDGIFGTLNDNLPSFIRKFLPQQTALTTFCKKNQHHYFPSKKVQKYLDQLKNKKLTYQERYFLENRIIENISLSDMTSLEFHGIIHEDNWGLTYSLGRILNYGYDNFWKEIISSKKDLRLYLKKATLFDNLGIIGICNNYAKKFQNISPATIALLTEINSEESDLDIKSQIQKILGNLNTKNSESNPTIKKSLDDFLVDPRATEFDLIKFVKVDSTNEDYSKIFSKLDSTQNISQIRSIIELIRINLNIKMTPWLISMLEKEEVLDNGYISRHDITGTYHPIVYDIKTNDWIVYFLENIYDFSFPKKSKENNNLKLASASYNSGAGLRDKNLSKENWQKKWEEEGNNFEEWGTEFYNNLLKKLPQQDTISIQEINKLFTSKFYQPDHKKIILNNLSKVDPCNHISRLELKNDSLSASDLKHFKSCEFKEADDFKDLILLFQKSISPSELISMIEPQIASLSLEQQGAIYYELLWNTPYKKWIKSKETTTQQNMDMGKALTAYSATLREGSFGKEHADAFVNILLTINLSVEKKLAFMLENKNEGQEEAIKTILADAEFSDLPQILNFYPQLPLYEYRKIDYLNDDWGIFIQGCSEDEINELKTVLSEKTTYQVYEYYLDKMNLDYKKLNGQLDFDKIYKILKFDCVSAFVGGGGTRDKHIFAVIKLLELHFSTRLKEPQKFNDILNSTGWGTKERTNKWINFFIENQIIKVDQFESPSMTY